MLNSNFAQRQSIRHITKNIYKAIVPEFIQAGISDYRQKRRDLEMLSTINAHFHDNKAEALLYADECAYMNRIKAMPAFPYDFIEKYRNYPVTIQKDMDNGLLFVMYCNKRLYFPRRLNKRQVLVQYRALLMEQDPVSPHRYMTDKIYSENSEIFMDVGCAEGMLALDLIENLKQVFLFECEENWIEALNATFSPWKEKVTVVNKYVSNEVQGDKICLDAIASKLPGRVLIKLDVEGAEKDVLDGAKKLLKREDVIFLCCTYHKKNDEEELGSIFKNNGFETEFTNGYMIYKIDMPMTPPYFRKGLLRARKECLVKSDYAANN